MVDRETFPCENCRVMHMLTRNCLCRNVRAPFAVEFAEFASEIERRGIEDLGRSHARGKPAREKGGGGKGDIPRSYSNAGSTSGCALPVTPLKLLLWHTRVGEYHDGATVRGPPPRDAVALSRRISLRRARYRRHPRAHYSSSHLRRSADAPHENEQFAGDKLADSRSVVPLLIRSLVSDAVEKDRETATIDLAI